GRAARLDRLRRDGVLDGFGRQLRAGGLCGGLLVFLFIGAPGGGFLVGRFGRGLVGGGLASRSLVGRSFWLGLLDRGLFVGGLWGRFCLEVRLCDLLGGRLGGNWLSGFLRLGGGCLVRRGRRESGRAEDERDRGEAP